MKPNVLAPTRDMLTDCVLTTVAVWVREDAPDFGKNREELFNDKLSEFVLELFNKREQF